MESNFVKIEVCVCVWKKETNKKSKMKNIINIIDIYQDNNESNSEYVGTSLVRVNEVRVAALR